MAQLVVGSLLDKYGARPVLMGAAAVQLVFFALMAGSREMWALVIALGFMFGAFGQIPINDFMIGKMASGAARARVYGIRYVVSFTALACALPLISLVYERWGFDTLFYVLSGSAAAAATFATQELGVDFSRLAPTTVLPILQWCALQLSPHKRLADAC